MVGFPFNPQVELLVGDLSPAKSMRVEDGPSDEQELAYVRYQGRRAVLKYAFSTFPGVEPHAACWLKVARLNVGEMSFLRVPPFAWCQRETISEHQNPCWALRKTSHPCEFATPM